MMSYDLDNKRQWEPFLNEQRKTQFFGSADPAAKEDRRVWLKSRLQAKAALKKFKKKREKNPNCLPSLIY